MYNLIYNYHYTELNIGSMAGLTLRHPGKAEANPRYTRRAHERYKGDEDLVKSILRTLACKCGWEPLKGWCWDTRLPGAPFLRDCGKNRRHATARESREHPVRFFEDMAKHVADFEDPAVQVPRHFFTLLDGVIARRTFSSSIFVAWHRAAGSKSVAFVESDNKHKHFANVLTRVRDLLLPRIDSRTDTDTTDDDNPGKITVTSSTNGRCTIEELVDLADALMYLACLLDDFEELQKVVTAAWSAFRDGRLNLITVSMITEVSIIQARSYEAEDAAALAEYGGPLELLDILYGVRCTSNNQNPASRELPGDEMNFATYDIACSVFGPIRLILSSFLSSVDDKDLPVYRSNLSGTYHASATPTHSDMTARERFREDLAILCEILPHFKAGAIRQDGMFCEDEISAGMTAMLRTRELSLYVLFTGQVFLNIHHILRQRINVGYLHLKEISQVIVNSLDAVLEMRDTEWPYGYTMKERNMLRELRDMSLSATSIDPYREVFRDDAVGEEAADAIESHLLLKRHPLKCGFIVLQLKVGYLAASSAFAQARGAILSCSHVYNALQRENFVHDRWQDMDLLFSLRGRDRLFHTASDSLGYWSAYISTLAYNTQHGRESVVHETSTSPTSCIPSPEKQIPLVWQLVSKYGEGKMRTLSAMLESIGVLNKTSSADALGERLFQLPAFMQHGLRSLRREHIGQMVCELLNPLEEEILALSFDYLWLDRQCWTFLKLLQLKSDAIFGMLFGHCYIEQVNQLPYICGYVLKCMQPGNVEHEDSAKRILAVVAELMHELCSKKLAGPRSSMGNVVCERLMEIHKIEFSHLSSI